jgi:hypothetical protein
MSHLGPIGTALILGLGVALADQGRTGVRPVAQPVCELMLHEEQLELEEYQLDLVLARSDFAAYEKIFAMVEELWGDGAIERMVYLESRYDRDAARLALARADLVVERQEALIEQYRLACDRPAAPGTAGSGTRASREALRRYRLAHCEALSKAVEETEVKLAFDREMLASVLDLRAGRVATRQAVILAELDVEKGEERLADTKRRVVACRRLIGAEPESSREDR